MFFFKIFGRFRLFFVPLQKKQMNKELIERDNEIKQKLILIKGRYVLPRETNSSKFFISTKQAERLVYNFYKKKYPQSDEKQRLQKKLVEAYEKKIKEKPHLPKPMLFAEVVNSPAPEFFVSKRVIREIIFKLKKNGH